MKETDDNQTRSSTRAGHLIPGLPPALNDLVELATDLRWTWNHSADALWEQINQTLWEKTQNPYILLQNISHSELLALAEKPEFLQQLQEVMKERTTYRNRCGWYGENYPDAKIQRIAFFSMEYGLGSALPFYAGGLGILSGDTLKAASDLCIPMVGVGLLYHQGYFRQMIDAESRQHEIYTSYDPAMLPVRPVYTEQGDWLKVAVDLPGRSLLLRVWMAQVGSLPLYLLDSNHPLNSPTDQGITSQLYGGGREVRFLQEMVLGIGGWKMLEALELNIDVCHLNEGHAAFVILARTLSLMQKTGLSFWSALWINRAGTLFTTHTPVASAFDTYDSALITQYAAPIVKELNISLDQLLALGRKNPQDSNEAFNLAWFSMRCSLHANGVSQKHGETSRYLFRELYPQWPVPEIPIHHITNGIHMPSWDSPWADKLWTDTAGKERWQGGIEQLGKSMTGISDKQLWAFRNSERQSLVDYVRNRHAMDLSQRGENEAAVALAERILDPNILTLGFARRFTEYKRPYLLLMDRQRLCRLLNNPIHPVQILIAGKAHAQDEKGKTYVHEWAQFSHTNEAAGRVVFLGDYDIPLAREMVQGVDVWINTPRSPWEACGTSGMKVLVNGGLNLSVLDGWWAHAFNPQYGWAITSESDADDAVCDELFNLLETQVVPTFYQRNADGIPGQWVKHIRASMADLAPRFSSNRMLREYIENFYLSAAQAYHDRLADHGALAQQLHEWQQQTHHYWHELRWGDKHITRTDKGFRFEVSLYLDGLTPDSVEVQLYAEAEDPHGNALCVTMQRLKTIEGAIDSYLYCTDVNSQRPPEHFTPRVIAHHPAAHVPQENPLILWWQDHANG